MVALVWHKVQAMYALVQIVTQELTVKQVINKINAINL
jgi:hypothetical protein